MAAAATRPVPGAPRSPHPRCRLGLGRRHVRDCHGPRGVALRVCGCQLDPQFRDLRPGCREFIFGPVETAKQGGSRNVMGDITLTVAVTVTLTVP